MTILEVRTKPKARFTGILLVCLFPIMAFAQDITGTWVGYLETTGTKLAYELVIEKEGNQYSGYALTVFHFDGSENLGIKTIKATNRKGQVAFEDGEMIYNNYSTPPKRVKLFANLHLAVSNNLMTMHGTFITRSLDMRARNENEFVGTVYLQKQKDNTSSKLMAKLEEQKLAGSLSLAHPKDKSKENLPENTEDKTKSLPPTPAPIETKPSPSQELMQQTVQKPKAPIAIPQETNTQAPQVSKQLPEAAIEKQSTARKEKAIIPQPDSIRRTQIKNTATTPALANIPLFKTITKPAIDLESRKTEIIRNVFFTSDTLVFSLYDNGEIDGDTVSVALNNKILIAKKGLNTNINKLVVPITPDLGDSLNLVLYAENLGRIPPNTGLLIVQDGDSRTEIRFSGDLQKNAAILLTRKH